MCEMVLLGDLVTSHWSGYSFKSDDYTETGVPVLTKGDIKPRGVIEHGGKYIANERLSDKRIKLTGESDFLITTRDLTTAANFLGLVARARNWTGLAVNQGVTIFRVDERRVDPQYLAYWCEGPLFRGHIKGHYAGATQIHIRHADVMGAPVQLPPMSMQRRIASMLSAYDDLIENNTRRIAILEEMARRIYEEWFVRFRFPGHENVRMVESELGLVPEGWSIEAVEDVFETLGGGTPSKAEPDYWVDGVINWYAPTDLTGAKTVFMEESSAKINALGLSKSSAKLFPANSVMLTSRATIGAIAVNTTDACTNQGFITCLPSERFPLWLLFHWLKANVGLFESLGTGATFKEITKGVFRKIKLAVPEASAVDAFEKAVGPMMALVLSLERKNRNLRTTRDLLLPELISGELDVSAMSEPEAAAA